LGQLILFTTTDGRIVAVDLAGNQIWVYATGVGLSSFSPRVIVSAGVAIAAISTQLVTVNAQTGAFAWGVPIGGQIEGMSSGNGNVFVTSDPGIISAVGVTTGKVQWTWTQPGSSALSAPVAYDSVVYAVSSGFYAINAVTGAEMWQTSIDGTIYGDCFVQDGLAYFCTLDGSGASQVYALDLSTQGAEQASFNAASDSYVIGVQTGVC
jgi:outer membrane protein assembly factor BamB